MRRDEMGDLIAFLAVAEERSFTRAAARLGTSQSAVSAVAHRLMAEHPDVKIEIAVEPRFVDIAREGFDAGARLG